MEHKENENYTSKEGLSVSENSMHGPYLNDNRSSSFIQKKQIASSQNQNMVQRKNNTGLPDHLKSGIESLSGYSMDDVKVHYNSDKPAQLNAYAYAQGTDIHIASGQEKHLPHEAWHVVQQKQGRVKPTRQFKSAVSINDDAYLEKEADLMGIKALQQKSSGTNHGKIANFKKNNLHQLMQKGDSKTPLLPSAAAAQSSYHSSDVSIGVDHKEEDEHKAAVPARNDNAIEEDHVFRTEDMHTELGPKPGWGWNAVVWYELTTDGKLHPKWSLVSFFGYKQLGTNHGKKVYMLSVMYPIYQMKHEVRNQASSARRGLAEARQEATRNLIQIIDLEPEIQQRLNEWQKKHLSLSRIICGLLLITALGVGAIVGLHYIPYPKIAAYVYMGTTAVSEIIGLIYLIKWYYDEKMDSLFRIGLMGLNMFTMATAIWHLTQLIIEDAPVNTLIWGALPFGLLFSNFFAAVSKIKQEMRDELKATLTARAQLTPGAHVVPIMPPLAEHRPQEH